MATPLPCLIFPVLPVLSLPAFNVVNATTRSARSGVGIGKQHIESNRVSILHPVSKCLSPFQGFIMTQAEQNLSRMMQNAEARRVAGKVVISSFSGQYLLIEAGDIKHIPRSCDIYTRTVVMQLVYATL
ncbi:hypothetical protein BJ165DRAFT_1406706 [Panaeolus papilionaceus]|nr:hypothetical protein BJ165DRAFT_1406706 [Panaeolus papilionaceus]